MLGALLRRGCAPVAAVSAFEASEQQGQERGALQPLPGERDGPKHTHRGSHFWRSPADQLRQYRRDGSRPDVGDERLEVLRLGPQGEEQAVAHAVLQEGREDTGKIARVHRV